MAATAQAQAEAREEAKRAGIDLNKANAEKYRGRKPSYSREQFNAVVDMLATQHGTTAIAKATKLSRQAVTRTRDNQAAEASLVR